MRELIAIGSMAFEFDGPNVQTVNARELHSFLQVGKDFSNWVKDRIRQYGFVEGQDFVAARRSPNPASGNRGASVEYHITLDMAKELSMVERNYHGKQARLYFLECERKAREVAKPFALDNPHQLRQALLSYSEKVIALEAKVEEQAPKVEAFDLIAEASGSLTFTDAAKDLKIKPHEFPKVLAAHKWVFRRGNQWHGYQPVIDKGYIEYKEVPDQRGNIRTQARITRKGLAYLSERIGDWLLQYRANETQQVQYMQ